MKPIRVYVHLTSPFFGDNTLIDPFFPCARTACISLVVHKRVLLVTTGACGTLGARPIYVYTGYCNILWSLASPNRLLEAHKRREHCTFFRVPDPAEWRRSQTHPRLQWSSCCSCGRPRWNRADVRTAPPIATLSKGTYDAGVYYIMYYAH